MNSYSIYTTFWFWLLYPNMMHLRFLPVIESSCPLSILNAEQYFIMWIFFLPAHEHFNCFSVQFSSFQLSRSVVSYPLQPNKLQHVRPPCPSPNSCPLSQWCHPAISSSVVPFSSWPQSFPASESFQMSQLFASGGQSIGVSASTSVLPMNIHGWFPLGWTGWISLQSKELSRVFSSHMLAK